MMGGRRVVRVRGAGNDLADLFEDFLDDPKGDALVVVEAGDLAKGTGLRKLFESDDKAAAIACYADTARNLEDVVRDTLARRGTFHRARCAGRCRVAAGLGPRRDAARAGKAGALCRGPEKREPGRCARRDGRRSRGAHRGSAPTRQAVAISRVSTWRWNGSGSPTPRSAQVLRGAMGHFQRLLWCAKASIAAKAMESAMKRLRPPVHFLREQSFKAQAQPLERATGWAMRWTCCWKPKRSSRTTGVPAEAVCGRTLMNIAAMAKGSDADAKSPHHSLPGREGRPRRQGHQFRAVCATPAIRWSRRSSMTRRAPTNSVSSTSPPAMKRAAPCWTWCTAPPKSVSCR